MTTVIASFNVADYDHWRAGYAHAVGDPNLRSWRIWRGQEGRTASSSLRRSTPANTPSRSLPARLRTRP